MATTDDFEIEDTFNCQGKQCNIKVHPEGIEWTCKANSRTVVWEDLISVKAGKPKKSKTADFEQDDDQNSFTFFFIEHYGKSKMKGLLWKVASVSFTTEKEGDDKVDKWTNKIQLGLEMKVPGRPKHLLILVNPLSGNFKGQEIYETVVAPVFKLAGIRTEVIVLNKDRRCSVILQECNLHDIDGVASVGGDGTFSDCCNGMLLRAAREAQTNVNDTTVKLPRTSRRVTIIPTGTGNLMASLFHGSKDTLTSTLSLIKGKSFDGDVVTCHCGEELLFCGTLLSAIGFFSDMTVSREKVRDAGNSGAALGIVKPLWNARGFEAEINILKEGGDESKSDDWETITERIVEADCWMGEFGKAGWFPGYLAVHVHRPSSRWSRMKLLGRFAARSEKAHDLPHITTHKTKAYKITLPELEEYLRKKKSEDNIPQESTDVASDRNTQSLEQPGSVVAIDGEAFPLKHHTLSYRLHCQVLQLFGTLDK